MPECIWRSGAHCEATNSSRIFAAFAEGISREADEGKTMAFAKFQAGAADAPRPARSEASATPAPLGSRTTGCFPRRSRPPPGRAAIHPFKWRPISHLARTGAQNPFFYWDVPLDLT